MFFLRLQVHDDRANVHELGNKVIRSRNVIKTVPVKRQIDSFHVRHVTTYLLALNHAVPRSKQR